MSIINERDIALDESVNLAMVEKRIRRINKEFYNDIVNRHNRLFNMIWYDESGLSPQSILSQFGTDAAELFLFSSTIQTMLSQINPDYIPLSTPYEYIINDDGTVTLGDERVS